MQRHGQAFVFQDRARQAVGELPQPVSRLCDGGNVKTVLTVPPPLRVPALEPMHTRGRPPMRTEQPIQTYDRATADQRNRPAEDGAKTVEQVLQVRFYLHCIRGRRHFEQRAVDVKKKAPPLAGNTPLHHSSNSALRRRGGEIGRSRSSLTYRRAGASR